MKDHVQPLTETIHFLPLSTEHFILLQKWFNQPHVQAFYSLRDWTLEDVIKKFEPYAKKEKKVNGYIVYDADQPIAYLQYVCIADYPWPDQALSDEIAQNTAGLDIFIGEESYLGKGFGFQIIELFLKEYIWSHYQYCMVDPDIRNTRSLFLFKKLGFKKHKTILTKDPLGKEVSLDLMIKERVK